MGQTEKVSDMEKRFLGEKEEKEKDKWINGIEEEVEIEKELSNGLLRGFELCGPELEDKVFYGWKIPLGNRVVLYFGIIVDNIEIKIPAWNGRKEKYIPISFYPINAALEIKHGCYTYLHDFKKLTKEQKIFIREKLEKSEVVVIRVEYHKNSDKVKSMKIVKVRSKKIKQDIIHRLLMIMFPSNVKKRVIQDKKDKLFSYTFFEFVPDF